MFSPKTALPCSDSLLTSRLYPVRRVRRLTQCPAVHQNKHLRLMALVPELRALAHRGEDHLYQKHDANSPTSLLSEMLHARRGQYPLKTGVD